jgi:diguanylate cyclase (GGDEF)-like protein
VKHEVLPGELTTFRAVGATGFGLGAAGGLALWVTEPGAIHSDPVAAATTVLCLALAVAMAFVPWQRLGQGWQVAPPIVGVAVIAAAIQNMEDGRAVYDGFYLYVALAASYFLPGRHLRFVITAIAVASAVPLLGDARAESVVRWAYVAAGTATMALVLRSARKQVREYASQVRRLALVDQLTGALNRRGFEARANAELSRARRHEQEVTLIYLDLDGFKRVNDNLGHAAGDVVLRRAAISMGATLRGEDVLARVGGDEFVALLGLVSTEHAASVADRLVGAIRRVAIQDQGSAHVGATTACATYPHDGQTLDELMRAADGRLLERKRSRPSPSGTR